MDTPGALEDAARAMREGGVVGFPTDTVYGVGTAAFSREGIARVFSLKGRAADKALPVLVADARDLTRVVAAVSSQALGVIAWFWPGPLTLVLPRHPDLPPEIAPGQSTVGVRLPEHERLRALIRLVGSPLASSSANQSGSPPALDAPAVRESFPTGLAAILDGGPVSGGMPSTVLDLSDPDRPTVLREGGVSRWALEDVLAQWVY
jgi:L-threonylcarbamoyladenylate synthase